MNDEDLKLVAVIFKLMAVTWLLGIPRTDLKRICLCIPVLAFFLLISFLFERTGRNPEETETNKKQTHL